MHSQDAVLMNRKDLMEKEKYIDLKKVIAEKNPGLLKILPGFLFNYLKKIIHEDDLNEIMYKIGHLKNLEFINQGLELLSYKVNVINEENIPKAGRAIVAANHPLGGPEGLALMSVVGRYRDDFRFIVNDLLMNLENIRELFLPINKVGRTSRESFDLLRTAYESDILLLNFPFGLVSRKRKGKIEDLEWKKSFVNKARIHQRDIIPVFIEGRKQ